MTTAETAKELDGDDLYQQRARVALPLLVRQAHAGAKISYTDLARELGMPNPRNLNYVLGSIGMALKSLSESWGEKIPMIQALVVNKATGLPGEGIDGFLIGLDELPHLSRRARQAMVDGVLAKVFAYHRWNDVLAALGLEPVFSDFKTFVMSAAKFQGGGESERHRALKEFVAAHPEVAGLSAATRNGQMEFPLPSGDSLDVYFSHSSVRTAIEVKSTVSSPSDIVRGIFQCVKYRAVLRACIAAENSEDAADAVLVLEGALPGDLYALKNILDVRVIENVHVPT